MPSFFKNIKKLFTKPDTTVAVKPKTEVKRTASASANKSSHEHSDNIKNPYLDEKRAKAINADVISETVHKIKFRDIDNNAVKIVKDLHKANYESYLVGGCVRDLLLHKRPKDFDVTTGAHPEQAHKVFNRSRLIGRRFKLLHVRFGREIIEVATFRAAHENNVAENHAKQADSGMILRDNVYGTIDQDAMRRDFTINALYYDVKSHAIYDFTNGYQDISERKVRMIGDPSERYREDPVRMLRAVRFAAKLDFTIEQSTAAPIKELAPMLFDIAPARLFDEVLKLLQSGHGNDSLKLLQEYGLLETILPQTALALTEDTQNAQVLIHNVLKNTDRRLKQRKSVSPGFLYAVLLWPTVQDQLEKVLANKRVPPLSALHDVASKVILEQIKRTSIPKRFSSNIREIWELQLRLSRRQGNKVEQLIEHPRFRAAYDLLVLREKSGENLDGMGEWWTQYQSANAPQKEEMRTALSARKAPAKKKRVPKAPTSTSNLEKFDVVEQVAPKSRNPESSQSARPKRDKLQTVKHSTADQQDDLTAKPAQPTSSQPSVEATQIVEQQVINQETAKKAQLAESSPEQGPLSHSIEEQAAEPIIADTPADIELTNAPSSLPLPAQEIEPSIATEQATTEIQANSAGDKTATRPKKIRRSRAKNDPRNK